MSAADPAETVMDRLEEEDHYAHTNESLTPEQIAEAKEAFLLFDKD